MSYKVPQDLPLLLNQSEEMKRKVSKYLQDKDLKDFLTRLRDFRVRIIFKTPVEVYNHRSYRETVKDPGRLIKVAEVDTNSLEDAFRLTNHIDEAWFNNPEVKVIKKSRSTSIGDVMELDGKKYIVNDIGFKEV
jgi:hypothetical protein